MRRPRNNLLTTGSNRGRIKRSPDNTILPAVLEAKKMYVMTSRALFQVVSKAVRHGPRRCELQLEQSRNVSCFLWFKRGGYPYKSRFVVVRSATGETKPHGRPSREDEGVFDPLKATKLLKTITRARKAKPPKPRNPRFGDGGQPGV